MAKEIPVNPTTIYSVLAAGTKIENGKEDREGC